MSVCLSPFVLTVLQLSFAKVIGHIYKTFCPSVSLYLALCVNSSPTEFIHAKVISRVYVALCPSVSLYLALCVNSSPTEFIYTKVIGRFDETLCPFVSLYLALYVISSPKGFWLCLCGFVFVCLSCTLC